MFRFFSLAAIVLVFSNAYASDDGSMSPRATRHALLEGIWGLYGEYKAKVEQRDPNCMVRISLESDYDRLQKNMHDEYNYPSWLTDLDIELPLETIREIYRRYEVIQLRPIGDSSMLLIGCGNNPVDPHYRAQGHRHLGMVTVNPELSMNPTIVGGFGVDDLSEILPAQHFTHLVEEAVSWMEQDGLARAIDHALRPDYVLCSAKTQDDGYDALEVIEESAPYYFSLESMNDDENVSVGFSSADDDGGDDESSFGEISDGQDLLEMAEEDARRSEHE